MEVKIILLIILIVMSVIGVRNYKKGEYASAIIDAFCVGILLSALILTMIN